MGKTSTTGERLNEAKQINKSMMTLEKCIRVVRENQKNKSGNMVIPYRESKLTRLLQRYLNGDAQACMLVNISPSPITYDETSQILKFSAITASQIKLKTDSMMSRKSSIPKKKNSSFGKKAGNKTSSRSHAIFSIKCVRVENNTDGYISMISFCDLAGIERQNKTSTTGERLNEAKQINKSMMTLEKCIRVVRENQKNKSGNMVIPYRESKLTRLLQRYLNGDAQACMLANISPSPITYDETSQILKFSAITASQ